MCDEMAISVHILKIVENDPFLRLQMTAKEMFNRWFRGYSIIIVCTVYLELHWKKLVTIKYFLLNSLGGQNV